MCDDLVRLAVVEQPKRIVLDPQETARTEPAKTRNARAHLVTPESNGCGPHLWTLRDGLVTYGGLHSHRVAPVVALPRCGGTTLLWQVMRRTCPSLTRARA